MDTSRNDLLGELAADAALERSDFLVQATEQLRRFLDANKDRIAALGGLTLIDDEPDYLSIAPDLTFRSRSRYLDDLTPASGSARPRSSRPPSELVELYNPADIYAAFAEAAREAAGLPAEPTADGRPARGRRASRPRRPSRSARTRTPRAADSWAAGQPAVARRGRRRVAARRLYDLALEFQERSQRSEARLLEQFEEAVGAADRRHRRPDHRRRRRRAAHRSTAPGGFRAEVIPEDAEDEWRTLDAAPTSSSSSTTRPTSSATSPTRSPRPSRPSRPELAGRGRRRTASRGGRRPTPDDSEADGRRRTRTADDAEDRRRPRDDAARRRGARREPGDPAGPVAAGVPRPGARDRLAGRPVRPRPDRRLLRDWSCAGRSRSTRPMPRPASSRSTSGSIGRGTDWFTRLRPGDAIDMLGPLGPAVRGRPAQSRTCCWSRAGSGWPASGCSPTRRSATGAR